MTDETYEHSGAFMRRLRDVPPPRSLFFDLDGTLYRGSRPVPGADRLVSGLMERGMRCWFVTNNSTRTPEEVAEHLRQLGIPAEPEQVITSALAAAGYVREHHPGTAAYVIGENGLVRALEEAAITVVTDPAAPADLVVQGTDRRFDYGKLSAAVRHIMGGARFIQTNPDLLLPSDDGMRPGSGSIGAAIQAATGQRPVVIGKPSAILMTYALQTADVRPEEVWVIGDNPLTDIAAASGAGCPSVLMLTGVCTEQNWEAACRSAGVMPDAVCAGPQELESILNN